MCAYMCVCVRVFTYVPHFLHSIRILPTDSDIHSIALPALNPNPLTYVTPWFAVSPPTHIICFVFLNHMHTQNYVSSLVLFGDHYTIKFAFPLAAGTQTSLTFPTNFDLNRLLHFVACHTQEAGLDQSVSSEGQEKGEATGDSCRDLLGNSLRRKLFGQPERQVVVPKQFVQPTTISITE